MDKRELHNITLGKFKSFFPEASSVGLGDDFYIRFCPAVGQS